MRVGARRRGGEESLHLVARVHGDREAPEAGALDPRARDRFLVGGRDCVEAATGTTVEQLIAVIAQKDEKIATLVASAGDDTAARFSPDGQWIAFQSNVSGNDEVYVRRTRGAEERLLISAGGGTRPRWMPDGKKVVYFVERAIGAARTRTAPQCRICRGATSSCARSATTTCAARCATGSDEPCAPSGAADGSCRTRPQGGVHATGSGRGLEPAPRRR